MTFEIHGQIRGGKNHMNVDPRTGRHFPNKAWALWRDQTVKELMHQRRGLISYPMKMTVEYWKGDLRKRDISGLMDSIFHCFERARIIQDDCLILNMDWRDRGLDREDPRAIIALEELVTVE